MSVFLLNEEIEMPSPALADQNGLLAIGGDLSPERLILAYSLGTFPWYNDGDPILWWSPDPRLILLPKDFKASSSLKQSIRNKRYEIRADTCFEEVINWCSSARERSDGTWITKEMKEAFILLHKQGYAHSIETFQENKLVGGLYGVSIGRAFFGESMFYLERDASKTALMGLSQMLSELNFSFIDCQQSTAHLISLGAMEISRKKFLSLLEKSNREETLVGSWTFLIKNH